jgi:hypothetical protein
MVFSQSGDFGRIGHVGTPGGLRVRQQFIDIMNNPIRVGAAKQPLALRVVTSTQLKIGGGNGKAAGIGGRWLRRQGQHREQDCS